MRKSLLLSATLLSLCCTHGLAGSMEEDFKNPPNEVGPYVWWHWMGANVSKEGITKDLEAMKASGIGGATIFNLASADIPADAPTKNLPWPDITYRSPKYWELLNFSAMEANRLGLELGMQNCVGYSATGGPWVTPELSMQKVVFSVTPASGNFSGVLPQPKANLNYYRDIAVLAVPETDPVDPKEIVDLTRQMNGQGRLEWNAPAGNWKIYRFGHTSTGKSPHPCPEGVKALEVDKMSASASKYHFEQVLNPLREHLGPAIGKSFRHITMDSYEAGLQNWTPTFREEFLKRKGYDPIPWLPLLDTQATGSGEQKSEIPKLVLGSAEQTARFQWDHKDLIAQLYQECNFEQAARMIHEAGLQLQFEAYYGPFDTIAGTATADIPMCELWTDSHGGVSCDITGGARAAGRRILAAEALTGWPTDSKYTEDPSGLKVPGDGGYVCGVNRLVLHHWVHQPFGDAFKPGMGMGWWGTHFGRNQTWAEPGKAYFKYLARTQSLLQRGEGVGDFLTLGHSMVNADAIPRAALLRGDVRVENGQIVLPSGRRYPFLLLPPGDAMLPEVAAKLKELVQQGAIIGGNRPTHSPSLSGYPACDEKVRQIADELWGATNGKTQLENSEGKVFSGTLPQLLDKCGITPIFTFPNLRATARRDGSTEIFFIANFSDHPCLVVPSFRIAGKQPEIWQAEDGTHAPAGVWREVNGRTEVPLTLRGKESIFVLFRQPASKADHAVSLPALAQSTDLRLSLDAAGKPVLLASSKQAGQIDYVSGKSVPFSANPAEPLAIGGSWEVAFAPGWGAPAKTSFPELKSWSEQSDPAVKYFSGTAIYRKEIEVPADRFGSGKRLILDLGAVSNLASVKINGIDLGVCWYAPFQVNATAALKPGRNTLEIAVTNTWANRLIGDEQEPEDLQWGKATDMGKGEAGRPLVSYPDWFVKGLPRPSTGRKTFSTWNYFTKESPLYPAGLLGPVVLRQAVETPL